MSSLSKEKRIIIVGISYDRIYYATVFINSELNQNIFNTQELRDLNIHLEAEEIDFIDHNSFIDCSDIRKRNTEWLSDLISKDPTRVLGDISEKLLKQIKTKIKSAPTISVATKKEFGLFM